MRPKKTAETPFLNRHHHSPRARPETPVVALLLAAFATLPMSASLAAGEAAAPQALQTQTETEPEPTPGLEFGRMLVMQRCANCHAVAEGEDRFAAPLHHLFGREPGSIEGYTFSINMQRIGTPWTARTLEQWLTQTTFDTPDIRMRHVGIAQADQRNAVVDYLSTLPGNRSTVQE